MEHDIRAEHVRYVGQRPRSFLGDARDDIPQNFESDYQHDVDGPRPYLYDSGSVPVSQRRVRDVAARDVTQHIPLALTQFALRLGRAD